MCDDMRGVSNFCAIYSAIGALFMLMVAMMLTYQPLLISGIDDHKRSTYNAYGAMFAFIVTFLASIIYLIHDASTSSSSSSSTSTFSSASSGSGGSTRRRSGNQYEGVAQGDGVRHDYALNLDLPESAQLHAQEGAFFS